MTESPIFVRTYDLLLWLIPATERFPRSQRFVLAHRVQNTAFDLYESLVVAGQRKGSARLEALQRADTELAKLRCYLRLALDNTWLSMSQFEHVSRMTDEIGRLLGGWRRKEGEAPASAAQAAGSRLGGQAGGRAGGLLEQQPE